MKGRTAVQASLAPTRPERVAAAPGAGRPRIAIVGGGASGVIAAAHLLRETGGRVEIVLIERRAEIGRGVAYSTADPAHLLNVPASNMSALAAEPGHFVEWLVRRTGAASEDLARLFAPRRLYGAYLGGLLEDAPNGAVRRLVDECVRIADTPAGVSLELRSGARLLADLAILATGHDLAAPPGAGPVATDAHQPGAIAAIAPDEPVAIIGTGLTMVDVVVSLHARGHRGSITAVSRRGLTPESHRSGECRRPPTLAPPFGAPVPSLLRWLRRRAAAAEAAGEGWRSAVDALRPHTQGLWQAMSADRRRQFLRHARPWWDVRRHRMAPEIAATIERLRAEGQLRILAGRILEARRLGAAIQIRLRQRGAAANEVLSARHLIGCTGTPDGPSRSADPLVRALLAERLARPDALDLGLDIAADGAVIDARGRPSERLFAVGPVTRAAFWETIAVPDIRAQCAALASQLAGAIEGPGPTAAVRRAA